MNMIAAAALLASISVFQAPALAQNESARLRLTVVDESNAPVPNATVTVFTMHGPRTANADAKGVVVFTDLPTAAQTQWWARAENAANAEAMRLKSGENAQTVTLHAAKPLIESGS
jgi:hypothetical protein